MNAPSPWIRNCEAAEELEDLFAAIVERGMPRPRDIALMRARLRRNTQHQVEAEHVVSLTVSYLKGGETARRNTFSQTSRKQRRNAEAGMPTLRVDDDAA